MSLHWPEELRFLTYVVGQVWPDGDEDRMFAMAQAWLDAAESLERQVLPVVRTAEGRTLSGYGSGAGREQIAAALHQLQAGDHSIEQLVKDFQQLGASTRNAATTLEATKLMTIFAVTMLAAQIAGAWLWPPTAPAVEAAAIGATRATLYRVSNRALTALGNIPHVGEYLVKTLRYLPRLTDEPGRIAGLVAKPPTALAARATPGLFETFVNAGFRATTARTLAELPADAVQFLISKAVNNLIWAGGLDVTIQGIQMSKGHRDEFNATQFGMSVAASTGGWYAGALVATNLSKYGAKFLTSRGKDPTAGFWGAGLGLASGTVPTVVSTLVGGGIAMGFTGSFDPTIGLIGALSANSLIGSQRGYIGMRGDEPATTRAEDGATVHNSARSTPGADGPANPGRPQSLKSTEELISEIRGRDDAGYQAARAQDRAAVRDAERTPEGAPVNRRANRDAHVNEQRSQIKELADARRAVLDAELANVRARDRAAAAPDDLATLENVAQTRQRLNEAVDADAATRARIQARLDADGRQRVKVEQPGADDHSSVVSQRRSDTADQSRSDATEQHRPDTADQHRSDATEQHRPDTADQHRSDATEQHRPDATEQHRSGNGDRHRSGNADRHRSETDDQHRPDTDDQRRSQVDDEHGRVSAPTPRTHPDGDASANSVPGRRGSTDDNESLESAGSHANSDGDHPTASRGRNSGPRTPAGESEIVTAPIGPTHNRTPSHADSSDSVPSRIDLEPGGAQRPARGEDPTMTALRNKLSAAESRIATLRDADTQVATAHRRAQARGLDDVVAQRAMHRDALAEAKTVRETTRSELNQARTAHADAPDEQKAALQQRIGELESTLRAQDRTIADETAHLAVLDRQLTRASTDLDTAIRTREQAAADVRRSMTELEDAGRAAASAGAAHPAAPARTGATHPFEELAQLQREVDQRRNEVDLSQTNHDELARASGATERRIEQERNDFDAGLRTERSMIDGGYMSGKPKSRKLPLAHGMPDPFTALPPPTYDFWLSGGIHEQPKPEPDQPVDPAKPDESGKPEPDKPGEPDPDKPGGPQPEKHDKYSKP
ncbi:hypothetical protein DFR70_108275 [Nocardia tenerifensis]|uniref:Outer membrane channel protein CpnT-like N-terminal domain-containing protein n=1 Tax=Nocardia tenerifensis TaxID=228006 RepID=A0A318K0C3_9NOCA|nr:hypothetical protein [Nocardia tenerifensis]PXX61717.1 hypothetical protein DFR70_108275 [Nocardia tenerifensis]